MSERSKTAKRKEPKDYSNINIKGRKVKLLPTKEQEQLFWQFAGTRRFVYNWALDLQMKSYKENGKLISFKELQHRIVVLKHEDKEKAWLKTISCDVAKQAIKDLECAYNKFFDIRKKEGYKCFTKSKILHSQRIGKELTTYDMNGHPKFKKKLNCDEGFHQDCMQVQFKDDKIFITKIGWVKIAKSNIFPEGHSGKDFKIYNAKVKTDGLYWYFVAGVEVFKGQEIVESSEPIGIDLGVKDLAILSNGEKFKNINKTQRIKKLEKRKRRLQRKVSRKYQMNKQGDKFIKTSNSIKLEKRILNLNHKLTNIRKNYRHQVTSSIVKRNPIFISMEDLNVQGMMKNKHLAKSIQQQGFGYIRTYLTYKCNDRNIPIYFTDRFYPSSKTCSCCGFIKSDLKLKDRIFTCPNCNNIMDRDINAAINIKNYGQQEYNKSIIKAL